MTLAIVFCRASFPSRMLEAPREQGPDSLFLWSLLQRVGLCLARENQCLLNGWMDGWMNKQVTDARLWELS